MLSQYKRSKKKSGEKKRFLQRKVTARAPTGSSAEKPILEILAKAQDRRLSTKVVISEILGRWFDELSEEDLIARYPSSRRKIVETRIKFARKNLIIKGQLYPVDGEGHHSEGYWEISDKGLERLKKKGDEDWKPRYSIVEDAIILIDASE